MLRVFVRLIETLLFFNLIFILFFAKDANEEDVNLVEDQIKSALENGIQDPKKGKYKFFV